MVNRIGPQGAPRRGHRSYVSCICAILATAGLASGPRASLRPRDSVGAVAVALDVTSLATAGQQGEQLAWPSHACLAARAGAVRKIQCPNRFGQQ
jgi:hypothetical protein